MTRYTYVGEHQVVDPDTGGDVDLEVWKDNTSGGIFAIDVSFVDQNNNFFNPFSGRRGHCEDDLEFVS